MKGIAAPLAALEGNALPLAQEGAEGEESAPGEGFDALLALVNAQAPNGAAPVKALAPSAGVQCAQVETSKDVRPTGAPAPKSAQLPLDVAPTQVFLPWLAAPAAAAGPATPSGELDDQDVLHVEPATSTAAPVAVAPLESPPVVAEVAVTREMSDGAELSVRVPPQSGEQSAPAAPEPSARKGASKTVPPQRKAGLRSLDEGNDRSEHAAGAAPAPQNLIAAPLSTAASTVSAPVVASGNVSQAVRVPAQPSAPAAHVASPPPLKGSEQDYAGPGSFDELVMADGAAGHVERAARGPIAPSSFSEKLESAPEASLPLSDPETQARVTSIEFFSTGEVSANDQEQTAEAVTLEQTPDAEQLESAPAEQREHSTSEEPTADDRRAPDEQAPGEGKPGSAQAARFAVTEGKGMRGLDAVVASLLRPYADKPDAGGGVRVPSARVAHISVETGKSQNVKLEERAANANQALDAMALRRQEDERNADLRELTEPSPSHLARQADAPLDLPAELEPAQASTPLNAPPAPPDPDAALMGKIARGESLNAAVSIEHPELGAMEVVVHNENGRIDVRATLETPRAAAVLRAHESALRYGVQQAGMTFGALRVNARTGETKLEKSRDVPKRRRDRDWEA